jgi:hypothetical protein
MDISGSGAVEAPPFIASRSHSLFSDSVTYYLLMVTVGSRVSSLKLHILKSLPCRIKDGINESFLLFPMSFSMSISLSLSPSVSL